MKNAARVSRQRICTVFSAAQDADMSPARVERAPRGKFAPRHATRTVYRLSESGTGTASSPASIFSWRPISRYSPNYARRPACLGVPAVAMAG